MKDIEKHIGVELQAEHFKRTIGVIMRFISWIDGHIGYN